MLRPVMAEQCGPQSEVIASAKAIADQSNRWQADLALSGAQFMQGNDKGVRQFETLMIKNQLKKCL
jgi:hypothetical protein